MDADDSTPLRGARSTQDRTMTDETTFEWQESDEQYTEFESDVHKLSDVLGTFHCKDCGDRLYLTIEPDPDNPSYRATCEDCELSYRIKFTHVKAFAFDSNV